MRIRKPAGFWTSLALAVLTFALYFEIEMDAPWSQVVVFVGVAFLVLAVNFALGWWSRDRRD